LRRRELDFSPGHLVREGIRSTIPIQNKLAVIDTVDRDGI